MNYLWITCAAIFSAALILTFSRGAWIAAFAGLIIAAGVALRGTKDMEQRQAVWGIGIIVTIVSAFFLIYHWDAFVTRLGAYERLERWSVDQRTASLSDGINAWNKRPLFGWGSGASVIGIADVRPSVVVASEPPHFALLTTLVETGIVGILAIVILGFLFVRDLIRRGGLLNALPLLVAAGFIAGTDHYLWTLWAGQAVLTLTVVLSLKTSEPMR
jgi:O-antigen ligase